MWNQLPVAGSAILAGVLMWAEAVLAVPQETVTEVKDIQAEYFHRAWNREDGLPDNVVNAILQTRDGYLWLATPSGLARFDGLHFTVFNLENSPDMGSDHCWSLAEDNSGTLWILTNTGLLARTEAGFRQFHASRESPGWRPLLAAGRGGIWTAIPPKPNLDHLDSNGGLASYRLPRVWEWISSVAELNDGSFWVGEVHGAFWIDPHLKEAQAVGSFATEGGPYTHTTVFLPDGTGYDLLERSNFHDAQLYRIEKYGGERCGTNVISNVGRRLFLAPDRQGNLWMPSAETGLLRYAGQRFTQFIIPRGLDNDLVLCMYESHDGLLWFGSGHSGLHRLQPRCVRTITASDGLAGETAECLLESRDGSLWVGTENGLSRFTQGRCTNFYQKDGLARKIVRSLAEDQEGVIWIGTLGGLNRMKDNQLLPYRFPGLWEEGKIRALLAPKAGGLWVGTVRGLHWLYQGRGAKFTTAQGLSTNEVLSLLEDRSGDLWVGTPGGGLNRLHWQDGFGRSLSPESPDPLASISNVTVTVVSTTNGLSCNIIRSLYQDTNGVLWIGTDQGLNRYENGRCTVYRVEQGLVENQVNDLLKDGAGRLWLGGDRSISFVPRQDLDAVAAGRRISISPVSYNQADGFPSLEVSGKFSQPAMIRTRAGQLVFGTSRGAVMLDPLRLPVGTHPPPVVIERVVANGRTAFDNGPAGANLALQKDGTREKKEPDVRNAGLELPPGSGRTFEIQYTANSFIAPEETRFKYRLEGWDKNWIDGGTSRKAYYANLSPGSYTFHVIAVNKYGIWNAAGAQLSMRLAPLFYETWTFYVACGVVLCLAMYSGIQWRIKELRKIDQLRHQLALEEQRKRIARDIHDELGASLTQIAYLSEETDALLRQSGQAGVQPGHITTLAEEAVGNIGEIVWANNPRYDTLDDAVAFLREYAAKFLGATPLESRLAFPERIPTRAVSGPFRRHLLAILKESLQNILKHAAATRVEVVLRLGTGELELTVRDNGRGMNAGPEPTFGNGLANMRERATELQGSIELKSQAGKGTTVHVRVPLPPI